MDLVGAPEPPEEIAHPKPAVHAAQYWAGDGRELVADQLRGVRAMTEWRETKGRSTDRERQR